MEIILCICIGIGLSAACGFRIFVPPLIMSIASLSGHLTLSHGFEWIGTYPALIAFSFATLLEIIAYYIPWLDNLLDSIATPAAVIAGIIVAASAITGINPMLKWILAIIAGGGTAGAIQGFTTLMRAASTAATGGLGNFIIATIEACSSIFLSLLSLIFPLAAMLIVMVIMFLAVRKISQKLLSE